MSINLRLPIRPATQNRFWGHTKGGRKYITKAGKEWREEIQWTLKSEINKGNITPFTDEELSVSYTFGFKDKRYGDTFNYEKALSDSLEGFLFNNDKQIVEGKVLRKLGQEEDYIEIEINKI